MKTKKIIKVDLYALCDIAAIMCLYFLINRKFGIEHLALGLTIYVVLFSLQTYFGISVVKNKSNKTLKAKPNDESKDYLIDITPQAQTTLIEGVKIDNKVYKIPNGVRVKVNKNNKLNTNSLTGYVIYKRYGGLQKQAPDEKWNKLFNA